MPEIDEAMGLAGMNPMVGMSGPHHASFIVNVMNHDKDLGDDGKILTGVSKSLDMDDNLYGIDQNGRFFAKRKYDVMERKDIIECYKVNVDCTALIESIEKEIQIPYDMRPVHKPSYIYEALTGHTLLDENQMEYDTLCEKVQLDKMTAALAGVTQGSLQRSHNMQTGKQDKEAGYIPDNDFPQGTENMSVPGMALESSNIDKPKDSYEGMKTDQDEAEWRKKIVNIPLDHDALLKLGYSEEYANKPQPCIMVNGKKYRARAELLLLNDKGEVLIQRGKWRGGFNYTLCGGGVDNPKYHITKTAIRECEEEALVVPKNVMFSGIVWFMKYHSETVANDGAVVFVCVGEYDRPYKGYVKKIDRDSFAQKSKWVNIKQANLGEPHKLALQIYLENKKTDVHESFQPNNQDLKYLREVANTKFHVDGETMYGLDESYKDSLKVYKSLSPNEQLLVSPNGRFINSPNLLFRYNHKINQIPMGFAEVYKYNDRDDAGFIIVAISPEARGQKIADILVQKSISGCKSNHIKKLIWRCDISNQASMKIAERNGFVLDKIGKSYKVYHKDLLQEEFKPSMSLEDDMMSLLGVKK